MVSYFTRRTCVSRHKYMKSSNWLCVARLHHGYGNISKSGCLDVVLDLGETFIKKLTDDQYWLLKSSSLEIRPTWIWTWSYHRRLEFLWHVPCYMWLTWQLAQLKKFQITLLTWKINVSGYLVKIWHACWYSGKQPQNKVRELPDWS